MDSFVELLKTLERIIPTYEDNNVFGVYLEDVANNKYYQWNGQQFIECPEVGIIGPDHRPAA